MKVLWSISVRFFAFLLAALYLLAPAAMALAATPKPTCSITLSRYAINPGDSITIKWTSTNATTGAITNVGNVAPTGQKNVLPSAGHATTYFGAFTGAGGTGNCQATVTLNTGSTVGTNPDGTGSTQTSGNGTNSATTGSGTSGTNSTTNGSTGGTNTATQGSTGGTNTATQGTTGGTNTIGTQTSGIGVNNATIGSSGGSAGTLPSTSGNSTPSGGAGLVPCGTGGFYGNNPSHQNSTGCQACDLATLIQNIITFAIGLAIPIAAALFAWAGVLFFTSAGDTGKLTKAKQIFRNAFIGFIIAITAWIVINTVLSIIFSGVSSGSWFKIQCVENGRQVTGDFNQVMGALPNTSNINANGSPSIGTSNGDGTFSNNVSCSVGSNYDTASDTCYNPNTDIVSTPTSAKQASADSTQVALDNACDNGDKASCDAGNDLKDSGKISDNTRDILQDNCDDNDKASCDALARIEAVESVQANNTDCSPTNIQNAAALGGYNLTQAQANTLSCIAIPESACGTNTKIATTPDGKQTSAAGMFQIVFGSNNDQCHNLNLDICTKAAEVAGFQVSGNLNCYDTVIKQGQKLGSPACRAAAANINCNASAAACLVKANNGKYTDWIADNRNSKQTQCINQFANG